MARTRSIAQLGFDFEGTVPAVQPVPSKAVWVGDLPPWNPRWVQWFHSLNELGQYRAQVALDKRALSEVQDKGGYDQWLLEFLTARIAAYEGTIKGMAFNDDIPF